MGPPVVLVLGGWEPSGRMGVLADWAAISALGARAVGVVTAVTAQGGSIFRSMPVGARALDAQLRSILGRETIAAVKMGVIPNRELLRAATSLLPTNIPWVVDPVVKTSKGQPLSALRAGDFLQIARPHVILTPNRDEAGWLLGARTLASEEDFGKAAERLAGFGYRAVILKGGHARRGATDIVASGARVQRLRSRKLRRNSECHRGTGCRFASATAVALARGLSIWDAARSAKAFVREYLLESV